ncbi:MAG: hypothetical protein IT379_32080 [Deltaproteobacteria bacterium]|nr:hypothetical protein [Deltaproteobacteria bacterium]
MGERVTGAELARRAGLTPAAISTARRRGRITRGKDKKYDAESSLVRLDESRTREPGPGRGGKKAKEPSDTLTLTHWKTVETREMARKRKLERLEIQGALVRRSVVEQTWASEAALIRDQLMQIGSRLAGRLAAETDPRVCGRLVDEEVLTALRGLAGGG